MSGFPRQIGGDAAQTNASIGHQSLAHAPTQSFIFTITINQSMNQNPQRATRAHDYKPHPSTTTRAANPASRSDAGLGGLRASRASVGLRDSLHIYTLFTEAHENYRENNLKCIIFIRKKTNTRARDLAYYYTLSLSRKSVCSIRTTAITLPNLRLEI